MVPSDAPDDVVHGGEQPQSASPPTVGRQTGAAHVADTFSLFDVSLRDPASGEWDLQRVAPALDVPLTTLMIAAEVPVAAAGRALEPDVMQTAIAPDGNVLAMALDTFAGDLGRLRSWLRLAHPSLQDRSPLECLLVPGQAHVVEQWVARACLSQPAQARHGSGCVCVAAPMTSQCHRHAETHDGRRTVKRASRGAILPRPGSCGSVARTPRRTDVE